MELKISEWKEFKISDVFVKKHTKHYITIPEKQGDIAVVTCQSVNNGVAKYCEVEPETIFENAITVSTNGICFDCFFHDYKFTICRDVEVLFSPFLNVKNALFIIAVLKKQQKKYSYGNKPRNNIVWNTKIKLPVDTNGNPDWEFMEKYIQKILEQEILKLNIQTDFEKKPLEISKWRKFKIGEFFNIKRGERVVINELDTSFKNNVNWYNLVTSSIFNNAVVGYHNQFNTPAPSIVIATQANGGFSSYQDEKCWVLDTATSLTPKYDFLNKYVGLFLVAIFKKNMVKFTYGNGAQPKIIEKLVIKLPVNNNGNPDWDFMENYTKVLWKSEITNLLDSFNIEK